MPSAMAGMNLATLHMTASTRVLSQEHHTSKTDIIQGIDIPTPKRTDHTPPIMDPDMGDIPAGQSPAAILTATEATVSEGTPYGPHPAPAAAHTALQQWMPPSSLVLWNQLTYSHPILHMPLLSQMSLTPLHRLEPVSLPQLSLHCTGNRAKKSQAMFQQPVTNPPSCITALYAKMTKQ